MPNALTIRQIDGKPGQVYYPLALIQQSIPELGPNDVLVAISAAALNHRDLFIRQHLYPGVAFSVPLLADGCGIAVRAGTSSQAQNWLHRRVILNPGTGWRDAPEGPEDPRGYAIQGGTKLNPVGTAAQVVRLDAGELEEAPWHLSDVEAAALPLTGLTAWRALVTKSGNAAPGKKVLITGIGGGVALMALLYAVGIGIDAYVTSGSEDKLRRARELGAKGGVIYKEDGWEKNLLGQLDGERKRFDAIIDGAGGSIVDSAVKLLKPGGVVVQYGMTINPKMSWSMSAVLKNIELRGSTMGSRKEFADMVAFVNEKGLRPIISKVARGLDNIEAIEGLFDEMKKGSQFGKLVIDEIGKGGAETKL